MNCSVLEIFSYKFSSIKFCFSPLLIEKKMWEMVGGFSEEFNPGMCSDPDFNMKLWNQGVRIFKGINNFRVYHFSSLTTRKKNNLPMNRGDVTFLKKWGFTHKFFKKHYLKSIRFDNSESDRRKWIKIYDKLIKRILIYTKKDQILIKNPSNTARIKTILSKYPNAKFIHIHRNPYFVYLSTYKFFYELFPAVQLQKTSEETIHKLVLYNYKKIYEDYYNEYRICLVFMEYIII